MTSTSKLMIGALLVGAALSATSAYGQSRFTAACAQRDLATITAIEERGKANDVAAQKLADAAFVMIQARAACGEGRESQALALYDSIKLTPVLAEVSR